MSKDTSSNQPHSFPFPPFGMGVPFPMFQQPMGQFIPMGMIPINGSNMQNNMPDMSKIRYDIPSAEMFPQFSHMKRADSASSATAVNDEKLKSNDESRCSPDSSSDVKEKSDSSSYESPYMGSAMMPMMPSVVFFPYIGGFPGFVPSNLPQFSPCKINKSPTTVADSDQQSKNESKKENEKSVGAGSIELDVAQILVDMQGPSKQETVQTSDEMQSNVVEKETSNFTAEKNECMDINNSKLEPSKTSQNSNESSSNEATIEKDREKTTPTKNKNVPTLLEVKEECHSVNDKEQINKGKPLIAVPKIQIKMEKDECDEVGAESASTLDVNDVQNEDDSTSSDNVLTVFQSNQANNLHELQVPKRQNFEQPQSNFAGAVGQEQNLVILSNNMEVSSEVSIQSSSATEVNGQVEQHLSIKGKPVTEEQVSLEEELNDSASNIKTTFKCDVCSQLFRSPLGLQKHIEFHTDDGKHYTCSICFVQFHNNADLQSHLETHTKKRPHKCMFCPKAFRDPGSLQKHVRVHTGEKPFECKDCDRSFAEYSSLRKHQRVHTGEQPYKCQFCNKAFSISGNLQRHILIHTGERPYKCTFCPKAFNNPSHLRRHVKNLHFKGDSVVDEAMLSHYGNHVSKSGDETPDDVAMEMTVETMHNHYGNLVSTTDNKTAGYVVMETSKQ